MDATGCALGLPGPTHNLKQREPCYGLTLFLLQQRWWNEASLSQWYPSSVLADLGMRRLGNAGWNLMPMPARLNYYLGDHPWAAFGFGVGVAGGGTAFVGGSAYLGYTIGDHIFGD